MLRATQLYQLVLGWNNGDSVEPGAYPPSLEGYDAIGKHRAEEATPQVYLCLVAAEERLEGNIGRSQDTEIKKHCVPPHPPQTKKNKRKRKEEA